MNSAHVEEMLSALFDEYTLYRPDRLFVMIVLTLWCAR